MVAPLWVTTMDVHSAYWQFSVSSQHMVESLTVNPYMSLLDLKLCTHIWSTISISDPHLHWTFWSVLVWKTLNFHPMGGRLGLGHIFLSRTYRNVTI